MLVVLRYLTGNTRNWCDFQDFSTRDTLSFKKDIWRRHLAYALAPPLSHHQNECGGDHQPRPGIANAGIDRAWQRDGERGIENTLRAKRQRTDDPPERIDHGGNTGIGRPHQWQPFLDGAHPCLLEVLVGAWAAPEPAVIGEVEHPAGALAARNRLTRKDDLVADQRQEAWRARHAHGAAPVARDKAAAHL